MLLDRQHLRGESKRVSGHLGWMAGTLLVLLLATALYAHYRMAAPDSPRGGSWQGLVFGVLASLCMLSAGLFSWRKRHPARVWLGSARTWMKAHIWLGLLSLPLILFHSGFRLGGLLEQLLMAVYFIVFASGILGLVLQQYLPRALTAGTTAEAMYQQVDELCQRLRASAEDAVTARCGSLFDPAGGNEGQAILKQFYLAQLRSFLVPRLDRRSEMSQPAQASAMFESVRDATPANLHETIDRLESITNERRQLHVQQRVHGWLHAWLNVHVPLSMALLVLGVTHAVAALVY